MNCCTQQKQEKAGNIFFAQRATKANRQKAEWREKRFSVILLIRFEKLRGEISSEKGDDDNVCKKISWCGNDIVGFTLTRTHTHTLDSSKVAGGRVREMKNVVDPAKKKLMDPAKNKKQLAEHSMIRLIHRRKRSLNFMQSCRKTLTPI